MSPDRTTGNVVDDAITKARGARTIEDFIAPTLQDSAADAGRPDPRSVAMVNVAVTDDVDTARAEAVTSLAFYKGVPSHRNVLDRESVSKAGELAAVGDAATVTRQRMTYRDAGATDVV